MTPHRIAVACAARPQDPATYSGTPAALLRGIEASGDEGVPVAALLPRRTRRPLELALAVPLLRPGDLARPAALREAIRARQAGLLGSRVLARAKSASAASSARAAGPLDGCIQFGTEFRLPRAMPYVTYDDSTVVQAARSFPYPWITALGPRGMREIVRRQREVFEGARACCTTSHWAARSIVEDYGIPEERVHVVGIGAINVPRAGDGERDWGTPRFLFVGKAWERKNGPRVLEAFSAVRARAPHARLDVVGGHPARLSQPGVVGHGELRPGDPADQATLATLYASATCFVLPSLHEPSAISHVEAATAGIGSIGSTSGGSSTLIGDGGVTVDPRDTQALAAAMEEFAEPERAQAYGAAAREHAAALRWPIVAQRLRAALLGVAGPDPL